MPTPIEGYRNAKGQKVPSVTTCIGKNCGWSKPGLMHWAHKQGTLGRGLYQERDESADAGTIAHGMLEEYIHDRDPELVLTRAAKKMPTNVLVWAQTGFNAALEWLEDTRIEIVATEVRVVSEQRGYGGTIDAVGIRPNGTLCLPDWKTSKGTYPDHIVQIAAYGGAWEKVTEMRLDGGFYVCRFDKETGGFSVKRWPRDTILGNDLIGPAKPLQAFYDLLGLEHSREYIQKLAR